MNNSLQIAVLGAGYMGQNHAKILSSLPGVNLIAICDIDEQKTKKLVKQYKIKAYKDFKKLLIEERLHALSICLPTSLHFKASVEALRRKIPLFVEKPICANVDEAKKLSNLAKKLGVPLMVGHIERFNPVVSEIKQRVKSGEIGKIIKIHTQRFSPPKMPEQDISVIIDLATHDIDIISFILEEAPTRIFSETTSHLHNKEDFTSAILRFKSGVIGLIEVSWLHPTKIRSLTVVGEKGMYSANYLTQELNFFRQNLDLFKDEDDYSTFSRADVVKIAFEAKEPLYLELKAFTESIIKGVKVPVSSDEGLFALQIAEKIRSSGKSHTIVR